MCSSNNAPLQKLTPIRDSPGSQGLQQLGHLAARRLDGYFLVGILCDKIKAPPWCAWVSPQVQKSSA